MHEKIHCLAIFELWKGPPFSDYNFEQTVRGATSALTFQLHFSLKRCRFLILVLEPMRINEQHTALFLRRLNLQLISGREGGSFFCATNCLLVPLFSLRMTFLRASRALWIPPATFANRRFLTLSIEFNRTNFRLLQLGSAMENGRWFDAAEYEC